MRNCRAVETMESVDKSKKKGDEEKLAEEPLVRACDDVISFMTNAGGYFSKVATGAKIEPVEYNGKVKKGKIENLFSRYAKECISIQSLLGQFGMGGTPAPAAGGDGTAADDSAANAAAAAAEADAKMAKLDLVRNSMFSHNFNTDSVAQFS